MEGLRGRRGLVTGASSGLGEALARELARRGTDLVLVARRAERLERLAATLRASHGVAVDVLPMDLARPDTVSRLGAWLAGRALNIDLLVNNAGFGAFGPAVELDEDHERAMLALNLGALVALTRLVLPSMLDRRSGLILQVASLAGFVSLPKYATYAATKAFVLSWGQALTQELRGSGVSCTTLCPGLTRTEFFDVAGHEMTRLQGVFQMDPERVARAAIAGLTKRRSVVVPGFANKLATGAVRLFPRSVVAAVVDRLF